MLWIYPELERFLDVVDAGRVHTWMRKFGHQIPKPTVLYSNMAHELTQPLAKAWSKRMEEQWCAMLKAKLLAHAGARKLLQRRKTRHGETTSY